MTKSEAAYRKSLALALLLCFVSQNSGWARVPQPAVVMNAQSRAEVTIRDGDLSLLPAALGRVEETWTPSAASTLKPRVVLIQDAHGQDEAQKNTQGILEFLHPRLNFSQIIVEGGVGKLDPSRLLYFQEEKFNQAAADFLFQESEIGGPELFLLSEKNRGLAARQKVEGWGAEEKKLYLDNLQSYQDVFSLRETVSLELAKSLSELQTEASRAMNKELYAFFMQWMSFEAGSLTLEQEIQNLQEAAARHLGYQWTDVRLQLDWPMLVRYQELKRREVMLDAAAAESQAKQLLIWAGNGRVKEVTLSALRSILEKGNEGKPPEDRRFFWENFYGEAASQGFAFERYPDLFMLEGFRILEGEIEGTRLFEEANKLRTLILEQLQISSREAEILEGFRDYLLLKKFFFMELTREEFGSLEKRFGKRKKIPESFRDAARKALRYYQLALARDEVMAQSVIRRLEESSSADGTLILISGGFHRQGISEIFRREGIPYAVISPHFTEIQDNRKYEASMTGRIGLFDLSSFKVRGAQWMSDWRGDLPLQLSKRRELLEASILTRALELGATSRSELRSEKPWNELSDIYDDLDVLTGLKKTPGRKKQDPAFAVFLKFVRYEARMMELLTAEGSQSTAGIFLSALTDWLDGNLSELLEILEQKSDLPALRQVLKFSQSHMDSAYADSLVAAALKRSEELSFKNRPAARKLKAKRSKISARPLPRRFSKRPKSDSVRPYVSAEERSELIRSLRAEVLPSSNPEGSAIRFFIGPDFFKRANPWIPTSQGAVKLGMPKTFEGKTVVLEEDALSGGKGLRQIRVYESEIQEKNYLFSFIESETLGFLRSHDSFYVSADYTFTHPQFPEETFWVLTTQNFDVGNPQNKFRVMTDAKGNLLNVVDASAVKHPVYEVFDETGERRKGFFVMRMDGLWAPSEDFRGIVKGFLLGRERSQRGTPYDTAYIRVPGKNIYVAPGTEGLKKAEVSIEGRKPVSVKVGDKTYNLILKRNENGVLTDVAREGFYDQIGNFTGTITRFKADTYGRASLGAPITGAQVADASKDGVWMSAALENGVLIRTDEWKSLPPSVPYVFEIEKTETSGTEKAAPRVLSLRLGENKSRPRATHDFLVLRDFQGTPLDSYKLRIPGALFEKHSGQVTGFSVHARGEDAGRLQIKGKDYQLPGEYRGHPVTLLHFPEEKKLIFVVHSKTRTQVKDAYIYEIEDGEYSGGAREAADLEKELKAKYKYPFDLSRVWREKIRSEEKYEAARAAFEQGELDTAEQLLGEVSLKARRQYRLAQQLLNTWIPKRRAVLSSGTQTQQRRLLASFDRAFREAQSTELSDPSTRSELRSLETDGPLFWTGVLAGGAALTVLAFYRFRLVYRRIILDDYDDRVDAIREISAKYQVQFSETKPSQRSKARQALLKEYHDKFKEKKEGSALFSTLTALVFGADASSVHKQDQTQRAGRIEQILEARLRYALALEERKILISQGAGSEELHKSWPSEFNLPVREKLRNVLNSWISGILGRAAALYRGLLESVSRLRQDPQTRESGETGEAVLQTEVLDQTGVVTPSEAEESEVQSVSAAEVLEELKPELTPEEKLAQAVEKFRVSFSKKMESLKRQAAKAESVRRLERVLVDFDREFKADQLRTLREASLDAERETLFSEQTSQAAWVKETRQGIQEQLDTLRAQKAQQAAEARSAREAAELEKREARELHAAAITALNSGFAVLETRLRENWNRMILTEQKVAQRPEALAFAEEIRQREFLDGLDRRLWQRRLSDLIALLQQEFDKKASNPWAIDAAVRETPEALDLAEAGLEAERDALAEEILKAIVWDFDRNNAERNKAVRRILEIYSKGDLLEDALLTADNLVWLVSPEPETERLLAELWLRQSNVFVSQGKTAEALDALDAASGLVDGDVHAGGVIRSQIEDAKKRLGVDASQLPSAEKKKQIAGTRQSIETSQTKSSDSEADQVQDFEVLFSKLEETLLAGTPAFDEDTLQRSEPAVRLTLEIANARLPEARREELFEQLEKTLSRVAEGFQKARVAAAWADLDRLEGEIRKKLNRYKFPQDVFEDPGVQAFEESLEAFGLEASEKAALARDFDRRMNVYGALVWRDMNRRGLEYVRKHSRTLNDFMQSVSARIEEARRLQRQGQNAEAFEIYEDVAMDVREDGDQEMPEDVRFSTLSRVIVGMSNTRRYDRGQRNRYEEALQILEEALENVDPWSPFLAVEKGWVLYHWGQYLTRQRRSGQVKFEQALTEADILLLREPRDSSALDLKITALLALNRKSEAVELAHWTEQQGIRKVEQLTAAKDLAEGRSELRAGPDAEALGFREAENLREQDSITSRVSARWLREGDESFRIFSEKRPEIEAQIPDPGLLGILLESLQRAYEERKVPFVLERWLTDAYEKKLRKIREKEFGIYLFDRIVLSDEDHMEAYYDEKANRLFLSKELLEILKQNEGGGRSLREGLLFEMLFPARKVLVMGGSGRVGREVVDMLRQVYPQVEGTAFSSADEDLIKLDVTQPDHVDDLLNRLKPDVVVYAAGVAGVEEAEKDKARAELLNVTVPERISKTFPGQLIYFSSDYVFEGTEAPYKPKAETKPLNFYGETKARGEAAVLSEAGNTVIRLGLVYGTRRPHEGDPFHQVMEWVEGRDKSKLVLDDKQVRHPVWAGDVAGVVLQSINTRRGGIVQLNGAEDLTRYRFAEEVSGIYRRLYPLWLESPGSHLTSTQMWQWREMEQTAASGAFVRPQDAKMRNTVRPTRLEDVLRYLIPLYSVPDEGFFQGLYAAFETKNFEAVQKIVRTLENRDIRWAFIGRPEDLPGASENGVRIWNDSEREELYRYLIRDTKVQTSNAIRIRRAIDSMLMGIPEGNKGIVFLKPVTMGGEPNVELSLFPSFAGPKSMMYLLSYGYMEASSMGRILRFWVPTERESDGEINETVKTELAGGSYSKIERIINADGTTVIEKRAKISEDKGKLLAEARYMQSLQKGGDPAGRWFPEIYSIEENDGWAVVRMQDLSWPSLSNMIMNAFPAGDDMFGQLAGRAYAGHQSLLETVKYIYKTLTPDFYSQEQSATPEDFAEKYHFEKLEQRWREAAEKSPWMKKLLAAPYIEMKDEREPLSLNLPTMLRVYRRISKLRPELFKPPYLAKQHGDLHTGNILVDPFDFLKTGKIRNFKLIDPKYIPEGNDPLYDFAKLIHNYFGHYDLALDHHRTFNFDVEFPASGEGPAVFTNYFDDEASGTLMTLGRIEQFSKDFLNFVLNPQSDEFFPFEPDPVAWRKRLLFTHATLMAGLLPFHVVGDNREIKAGIIYVRSAQLLGSFLGAIGAAEELGDSEEAVQLGLLLDAVEAARAGNNKEAFADAVARLELYLNTQEMDAGSRSELRAVQPGEFLPLLGMDKAAVLKELQSEAIQWSLNKFSAKYPVLPAANKIGGYSGLVLGLDVLDEYAAKVKEVLGEQQGMIQATAEVFGISHDPFKKMVRDVLKIDYVNFKVPAGLLLVRAANPGEAPAQVKERLLRELGTSWNIPALRASLQERIPLFKQTAFSNARMIWGLDLARETMALYDERRVQYAGIETHIGEAFGFQRSQAKKMMEALTKDLRDWLTPQTSGTDGETAGAPAEKTEEKLTLLRALGLKKEQVIEVLNTPAVSWKLPEFVKWLETKYGDRAAWIVTRGHDELLKQFEIEDEYRAKIRETAFSHYRLLGPMSVTLGLDDRVLAGLANRLGLNIQDIELPPGTLLRILQPGDPMGKKKEIIEKLRAGEWKNFAGLKEELLKGHPFISPGSIRYAEFLWAVDILEEFSSVFEKRKTEMNGDLALVGRSFGWTAGSEKPNMERIQSRLPDLLSRRKAYREKWKKVIQEAQKIRRAAKAPAVPAQPPVKPGSGELLIHEVMTANNPHADEAAFERAVLIENFIFEIQAVDYEPRDRTPEMLLALKAMVLSNDRPGSAELTEGFDEIKKPLEALWTAIQAGNETLRAEFAVYLDLLAEETRTRVAAESSGRSELRHSPFEPFLPEENIWVRENAIEPFPGVTLQSIARAQKMLRHFWAGIGEIREEDSRAGRFQVPLVESEQLNVLMERMTGLKNRYYLYYLPELPEGSFKPYLAADLLDRFFDHPENLSKLEMVVAESTGNQGKAVASLVQKLKLHPDYAPYAAQLHAVIFVPKAANPEKVRAMKDLGAAVVNRQFSPQELRLYVQADEAGRSAIERTSSAPYFEGYKDASAYVSAYSNANPETSHYIRHGAPMGVAAYAVIMLEALDQWYRLQHSRLGAGSPQPVSSADFDAFIKFVAERPEFANIRFWVPGGSAGLGSGIAQVKRIRPDTEVFLTQVPGVDHVFKSLRAGFLIPKQEAVFDPEALRYVDGIAATAETTTYEIVKGMADAVMRVPHEDNNLMARLMLSMGLHYTDAKGSRRFLESELSPFLPLTNAVYGRFFQQQLPSLGASGKHILIPVTGRTTDAALEGEINDISYHEAYDRLLKISGTAPLKRSELRALSSEDREKLNVLSNKITDRKTEEALSGITDFRVTVEAREASDEKKLILQTLRFYEARVAADEARFEEARPIFDGIENENSAFRDPSTSRTVSGQREVMTLFEKYKSRLESQGYAFVRKLGTGTFGDGYLFTHDVTGRKAVLKVIGGLSLDMTEDVERMSASGQLAVEIDVNDRFFSVAGDDPALAVIPRNIEVFEEENAFGISMPEAIVMNFVEGQPAADFLGTADEDDNRIFREQLEEKWIGLLKALKAGGYLLIDYRPDNFFFRVESGSLVMESIDRGIMMAYPEDGSEPGRRELSAVGAIAMWKSFAGEDASVELRNRIRGIFELENETDAYMKTSVRSGDEARISEFKDLLSSLGFEFRGQDGKVGYGPSFQSLEQTYNLVLIPHGVTDANKRNVFHGQADSKDENLINDEGRLQAKQGAAPLAELIRSLGISPEEIVYLSSPLRRTQQTALISLKELETLMPGFTSPAEIDPDVIELSFGEWDGKDLAEIETELGVDEKLNAEKYRSLNAVMRAPSGENFLMVLKRVRAVLESWNKKYPGKTVVVYGHGTFAAAVRVLMQSPEAQVSDYVTWRDGAVPPRGMPTLFPVRSELRDLAGSRALEFAREVGTRVTGGIFSLAAAARLVSKTFPVPSAFAAEEGLSIPEFEREQAAKVFSQLLSLGGKAILPAQVVEAVTPRAREVFVELFVQGSEQAAREASVYIAGEGASKIKETFFTYGVFQKIPSAQKLFEIRSQQESVIANRLNRYAVAVSVTDASSGETLDGRIPAFLIRPEEIRKLDEADQARLLVRMTQLQLLAAVELKDQLGEAGKSRPGAKAIAQFLQKAGVGFTSGEGGYWMPSVQSLLSETVAARLAAYAATVKSA